MSGQIVFFAVLAGVAIASAIMVITRRNPIHSALYLLVTFFSVAAIFVLLHAEFLAAVQVLVYAGGIMVLFLFVIMLVRPPGAREVVVVRRGHVASAVILTALATGALALHVAGAETPPPGDPAILGAGGGNLETVALSLFRDYLLPFEVVSVLLLVAMVGAIVLARSRA